MILYILIGLIYSLINSIIRKLEGSNDPLIVTLWIFFWPLCFLVLGINFLQDKFKRNEL